MDSQYLAFVILHWVFVYRLAQFFCFLSLLFLTTVQQNNEKSLIEIDPTSKSMNKFKQTVIKKMSFVYYLPY